MTKPKSKMNQFTYKGFTAYEVAKDRWQVESGTRKYMGYSATPDEAREAIDRVLESMSKDKWRKEGSDE